MSGEKTDRSVEELFEQIEQLSPRQLERMLVDIRRERLMLDAREDLIRRMMKLSALAHGESPHTFAAALGAGAAGAAAALLMNASVEKDGGTGGGRTSKRRLMRDLMAQEPGRTWSPAEMHNALLSRGIEVTSSNVQITMQRMADKGEITRVGRGRYRLEPEQDPVLPGTDEGPKE